jgi:MFS transporter, putative metabolite:H+ symporter
MSNRGASGQNSPAALLARMDRLPFSKWHRSLMIVALLGVMFDAVDQAVFGAALPLVSRELKIGPAEAGMLATIGLVGAFFGSLIWGTVCDYFGRRTGFEWTIGIFAVFTGAMALAWDYLSVGVFRFVGGLGIGGQVPVASTIVSEFSPSRLRGRLTVLTVAAFPVGLAIAALLGLFILPIWGWRALFAIGVIPAVLLFFVRRNMPESIRYLLSKGRVDEAIRSVEFIEQQAVGPAAKRPEVVVPAQVPSKPASGAFTVFQLLSPALRRRTILLWIVSLFYLWCNNGIVFMLPTILTQRGMSLTEAVTFALILGVFGAFGQVSGSFLVDIFNRRWVIFVFYFVGAAFHAWFAVSTGLWMYVAFAFVGFVDPGVYGPNIMYANELYPTHLRATGVGWFFGIGRIGSFAAPAIIGWMLANGLGQYTLYTFAAAYLVAAIAHFAIGIETKGLTLEQAAKAGEVAKVETGLATS